jgi:hypothetical protein
VSNNAAKALLLATLCALSAAARAAEIPARGEADAELDAEALKAGGRVVHLRAPR